MSPLILVFASIVGSVPLATPPVASPDQQVDRNSARRLSLSNGEMADLVLREKFDGKTYRKIALFRDTEGTLIAATFSGHYSDDVYEISLQEGSNASVRVSYDLGFHKEGLKMPLVVEISGKRYRTLLDADFTSTPTLEKIRAAMRKLPVRFINAVRRLAALADGGSVELPPTTSINAILGEECGTVEVIDSMPLTDAEVASLQQRSASR